MFITFPRGIVELWPLFISFKARFTKSFLSFSFHSTVNCCKKKTRANNKSSESTTPIRIQISQLTSEFNIQLHNMRGNINCILLAFWCWCCCCCCSSYILRFNFKWPIDAENVRSVNATWFVSVIIQFVNSSSSPPLSSFGGCFNTFNNANEDKRLVCSAFV